MTQEEKTPKCYLGFETLKKCPNQCKGECGYKPKPVPSKDYELRHNMARWQQELKR